MGYILILALLGLGSSLSGPRSSGEALGWEGGPREDERLCRAQAAMAGGGLVLPRGAARSPRPSLSPVCILLPSSLGFPGSAGKESAYNAGDLGSIPGLGRSPGEGKGHPLQYPGLENFVECIVHGAVKGRTRLSEFHF